MENESKLNRQRLKLLKIHEILKAETDANNPMPTNKLIDRLHEEGIDVERKALYNDINILNEYGYEVMCEKGRSNAYYIEDRLFDVPELKIILDAINSARFITKEKTRILTDKVSVLAGKPKAEVLKNHLVCFDTLKHTNESVYYNVDTINDAITQNRKVSFFYFDYDVNKNKIYRKEKTRYVVNPISLVFSEDNYYLVVYNSKYKKFNNYRIDKMESVNVEKEESDFQKDYFKSDIESRQKTVFSMFSGEKQRVELLIDNSLINSMFDKFGENIRMEKYDDKSVKLIIDAEISPTFFGWCFGFNTNLKILSPNSVKEEYNRLLKEVVLKYDE